MKPVSDDFHITATPMLSFKDAVRAIAFYVEAFGAKETVRLTDDDGKIAHAEIRIGGAPIMLADEFPEIGVLSPESIGGSPVMILLQVADVDTFFQRAVAAGATVARPVAGDALRNGKLVDPFGHRWMILTRQEDLSPAEERNS
jgi:PhnB protein